MINQHLIRRLRYFNAAVPRLAEKPTEIAHAYGVWPDADGGLIRSGFLSEGDREALIALARDGSAAGCVTRRANALALLDKHELSGSGRGSLVRRRHDPRLVRAVRTGRRRGLSRFEMSGSPGKMSSEQAAALKAWVTARLPRSTRDVCAWIAREFGLVYEGLIMLLRRPGPEYHKPEVISRKLDQQTQKAFIASYENLMNPRRRRGRGVRDAVHPTHAARPVGCWAPEKQKLAIEHDERALACWAFPISARGGLVDTARSIWRAAKPSRRSGCWNRWNCCTP
jgi:hypothetical protein